VVGDNHRRNEFQSLLHLQVVQVRGDPISAATATGCWLAGWLFAIDRIKHVDRSTVNPTCEWLRIMTRE